MGIIGSVVGAGASLFGSLSASNAQSNSAAAAQAQQMQMFNTTQANLKPYMTAGVGATNMLTNALPSLMAPFQPTMQELANTPGYQFTLNQGLQGVQNSYAAQGLGSSGAALKGAGQYATGLASNTFQTQFANNLATNQTAYNMLAGTAGIGENAAAGVGNAATATGQGMANSIMQGGNAQAAGYLGAAGAVNSGINGVYQANALNSLTGNNSGFMGFLNGSVNNPGLTGNYGLNSAEMGLINSSGVPGD